MTSLEIEELLLARGFVLAEVLTHAVGLRHPDLPGQVLYLKDGRAKLDQARKPVSKQPLVLHPNFSNRSGFSTTRVAALDPNMSYMNSNMRGLPSIGSSATGVAVDVPDEAALDELLHIIGLEIAEPPSADADILHATNLPVDATERSAVIAARRGQGKFREELIRAWGACAVTGCCHPALLRASHIKPWRDCDNRDRLSPDNGLLLAAHLDAAFDRGLISFSDDGCVLIHDTHLRPEDAKALGIHAGLRLRRVMPAHIPYLYTHRTMHGFD